MIVKQGIEVTDAGRGELSTAYDCIIQLAQVPTPMLWSYLFTKFGNAPPNSTLGKIGPGGHMLVMALMRVVALKLVTSIPDHELQLAEGSASPKPNGVVSVFPPSFLQFPGSATENAGDVWNLPLLSSIFN